MTANHSIDPALFLSEHLKHAEPDLLRSMLMTFVDALCGAPYGARTRTGSTPATGTVPGTGTPGPGPWR